MTQTNKNVAASVKKRLLNKRELTKRSFDDLVQYYAIERFLFRLSKSQYKDKFVLKGAMMMYAWGIEGARPTMDIDVLGRTKNNPADIENIIREVCILPFSNDDGLVIDVSTIKSENITIDSDYKGVRIVFICLLENTRIRMQIDIGFGDSIFPEPVEVTIPSILDLPSVKLNGYTVESSIAEKFQAMLELGELNSRMKDFYDIWLFAQSFTFKMDVLSNAIMSTFTTRKCVFPDTIQIFTTDFIEKKQTQWKAFHKRLNSPVVPLQFADIINVIKLFLAPVIDRISNDEQLIGNWKPHGPWLI